MHYLGGRVLVKQGLIQDIENGIKHSSVFFKRVTDCSSQLTSISWSMRNLLTGVFISDLWLAFKTTDVTSISWMNTSFCICYESCCKLKTRHDSRSWGTARLLALKQSLEHGNHTKWHMYKELWLKMACLSRMVETIHPNNRMKWVPMIKAIAHP